MTFPNEEFTVADDDSALAIIIHLGLLGDFPKYEGLSKSHSSLIKHVSHPTHWFIVARFSGHTNPADNGYVVYGFPKSQFTIEDIHERMDRFQQRHCDDPDDVVSDFPRDDRN